MRGNSDAYPAYKPQPTAVPVPTSLGQTTRDKRISENMLDTIDEELKRLCDSVISLEAFCDRIVGPIPCDPQNETAPSAPTLQSLIQERIRTLHDLNTRLHRVVETVGAFA